MSKFNLSFKGCIQPGKNPGQVKARFGKLFGIDDPQRLEKFFSGEEIILRRNLERKVAAEYFSALRKIGLDAQLIKVTTGELAAQRSAAEVNARRKTREEEARRKAEQEAALRKAREEEARRKAEQEAALRKAREEEARRKAEQEAAAKRALLAEQKRKAREEAARKRAQEKQRKEQEAARRAAEKAEQQRQREEENARKKAAAEAARLLAEEEANRKKELLAQQKREQSENRAKQKAHQEKLRRERAQAASLKRAQQKEQRRKQRQEAALRRQERKRLAAEKRQQLESEQADREQTRKIARDKAHQEAIAEAEASAIRKQAEKHDREVQRQSMDDQAILRAARELSRGPQLKPVDAKVRSRLDLPQSRRSPEATTQRDQVGAPNLYTVVPFRCTADTRNRVSHAQQRIRRHLHLALATSLALLLLGVVYSQHSPMQHLHGTSGIAITPAGGPVLLAADQLLVHDRAGVGVDRFQLADLGVDQLDSIAAFTGEGELLALGSLNGNGSPGSTLLRCQLELRECSPLPGAGQESQIRAIAFNELNNSVFLADNTAGHLLQIDPEGDIRTSEPVKLPDRPVLRPHAGLLFVNSAAGPAISVYRYDEQAFGKQLDEVLLMPTEAVDGGQNQVRDFIWNSEAWWVILSNPESEQASIYRFGSDWDYLGQIPLPQHTRPEALVAWGTRTLVIDSNQFPVQRFNSRGELEAPLESDLLADLIRARERTQLLGELGWKSVFICMGLATAFALALAWHQGLRALVYRAREFKGAQPIDELAGDIAWIKPQAGRSGRFKAVNTVCMLTSVTVLALAVAFSVPVFQLSALLLLISGFAWGLMTLQRARPGHIGVLRGQLLLVDHADRYHLGRDARLQYRGAFLLIDDVVVFSGSTWLPGFDPKDLEREVAPLATGGVRVDRKTLIVKLLECRHPLAKAAGSAVIGILSAAAVLLLGL